MSIFDIIIILLILTFAILGWKRGVIKEAISLVGIIIVFILAFTFKEELGNVLCKYLPFFQFGGAIKGLVSLNVLIYQLLAFFIIYSVLYAIYTIVFKATSIIQKLLNMTIILVLPSKIAGAIVGLIKGYIVMFVALLIVVGPCKNLGFEIEGKTIDTILYKTPILSSYTSDLTNAVTDIYLLAADLTTEKLTVNEANNQIIDTMLKYNLVSKKTIEQLIVLEKLDEVKGLASILEKY